MTTEFNMMDSPWKKGEETHIRVKHSEVSLGAIPVTNDRTTIAYVPIDHWANERQRANAEAIASLPKIMNALEGILKKYETLAGSGDAGTWNWEEEPEVIEARKAMEYVKYKIPQPQAIPDDPEDNPL